MTEEHKEKARVNLAKARAARAAKKETEAIDPIEEDIEAEIERLHQKLEQAKSKRKELIAPPVAPMLNQELPPPAFKAIGVTHTARRPEPMVVMPKPPGPVERRLYQPNKNTKEWLTKEQALAHGFPWA